jgi:hypothetical protein
VSDSDASDSAFIKSGGQLRDVSNVVSSTVAIKEGQAESRRMPKRAAKTGKSKQID